MSWYVSWGKRTLDLVASLLALVILSPVFVIVGALIVGFMGFPIFFRQERAGLEGKSFVMYKFRSMIEVYDTDGNLQPDSKRVTHLGRWLRSTSLDELPELINIARGDMSLVGPRPLPTEYTTRYSPSQYARLSVRPGLTGLAQVRGRNRVSWTKRFYYDQQYILELSLKLDLKILLATVGIVAGRRGIYTDTDEFMPPFLDEERPGGQEPGRG